MKVLFISIFLYSISLPAFAGCWSGGVEYPEGTEKGTMVCGPDGYWKPKE